tara:strand:+ start:85 stop:963 length:879 start_codon:yes stop_codon:yes gene_type:complete
MNEHVYSFKQIVVGGNLSSMAYAFKHEYPIVYKYPNPPHTFDTLNNGFSKIDVYESCCLLLSLSGLVPVGDKAESIRVDDNFIKISTTDAKLIKIEYEELFVFEEEQIDNLPEPREPHVKQYQVIDWFNVRSGMHHPHEQAQSDSDFVKRVYFYPSERISGNHNKKDLAAFSYMTEEEIHKFEYSPTYVRFKVETMLKELGIRGQRNGKNPLYPEKSSQPYKYRALVIEPDRRDIKCISRPTYEDTENMKFVHLSAEEILNSEAKNNNAYLKKLKDKWNQELKTHGLFTSLE